ncbi:DUF3122 domain-containing protein [Aerosakkonema sp. BLCC-F183]|uniref:DUF3122 domain-containing protein n=1 Tax=Aerosakkonema sp. BLCC-F183 TaxID=3342834 RepID=UPI0035BB606D
MCDRIQQIFSRLFFLTEIVLFLFFTHAAFFCQPAAAVLRQHQDAPGVMRYHSQNSLRDKYGYAWQVLLFKVTSGTALNISPTEIGKQIESREQTAFNLRLVGFPGIAEFVHPHSLEILTDSRKLLTAADEFAEASPAANVGQYNVTNIIDQLPQNEALTLSFPLVGREDFSLKIPQSVVVEWQWLVKEI